MNQGGSFIEDVRSKRRKRIFERNGAYVLPCWVVKQTSQKRLAPLVGALSNGGQVHPHAQSFEQKKRTWM